MIFPLTLKSIKLIRQIVIITVIVSMVVGLTNYFLWNNTLITATYSLFLYFSIGMFFIIEAWENITYRVGNGDITGRFTGKAAVIVGYIKIFISIVFILFGIYSFYMIMFEQ